MLDTSLYLGAEVLRALGIDPTKRHVTRIIIDIDTHANDGVPRVEIHEDLYAEGGAVSSLFTKYKLVEEET